VGAIPGCVLGCQLLYVPAGRATPALVQASKEMDPHEYLEQFGAIPATSRDRVFPEFKEKVHEGEGEVTTTIPPCRFAGIDPSGGANPYCVLAIQDYGDMLVIFDEFYAPHYSTEEIAPIIANKDWLVGRKVSVDPEPERWEFDNLDEAVVDSASRRRYVVGSRWDSPL